MSRSPTCIHYRHDTRSCAIGEHGGMPTVMYCLTVCAKHEGPDRGLGDTIARATNAIGIRKCGGCAKRQAAINAIIPFGTKP